MNRQQVILVNEKDEPIGSMEKMEVHQKGLLHRAFSIFVFDRKGYLLIQKRANSKYHSPGLWTNTCCSHPMPGEDLLTAAQRRLKEELGFTTLLNKVFSFTYKATMENSLVEHELDHVFTGEYEGEVKPESNEVEEYKFVSIAVLKEEMKIKPQQFTKWFQIVFPKIEDWWMHNYTA